MTNKNFLSSEEIKSIYYDNKEIIHSIKDGLYPTNEYDLTQINSIVLCYNNGQLFCDDDPEGKKLQGIEHIHNDTIEYFMRMDMMFNPIIMFGEVFKKDIAVQFDFYDEELGTHAGIMYTTIPKEMSSVSHLEDNWYVYRYKLD